MGPNSAKTENLIARLATAPAWKPLPQPSRRVIAWLAASLPFWALGTVVLGPSIAMERFAIEPLLIVEQSAIVATAVTAAIAAFVSVIPGAPRLEWMPLPPLALWVFSVLGRWFDDIGELDARAISVGIDDQCLVPAVIIGVIPSLLIVAMLRRGAPLQPRITLALASLATGAFVASGIELFHLVDIDLTALVWHFGVITVVVIASFCIGPRILDWRSLKSKNG